MLLRLSQKCGEIMNKNYEGEERGGVNKFAILCKLHAFKFSLWYA